MLFNLIGTYLTKTEFDKKCLPGVLLEGQTIGEANMDPVNNDYQERQMNGSFCPTITAERNISLKGWPKIDASFLGDYYSNSAGVIRCSGPVVGKTYQQLYNAHRCYPYYLKLYTSCAASGGRIWVTDGDNYLNSSNSYNCNIDDCLPFYYGDECQFKVPDFDDDLNCYVSLGLNGTGECDCTNAKEVQPYCRLNTDSLGILHYSREAIDSDFTQHELQNITQFSIDGAQYHQHKYIGSIVIPVNGTYSFRFEFTTSATLHMIGQTFGFDEYTICRPTEETKVYEFEITRNQGTEPFEILLNTGCAFNNASFKLQWKTPFDSEYTSIPSKYLYHK